MVGRFSCMCPVWVLKCIPKYDVYGPILDRGLAFVQFLSKGTLTSSVVNGVF